MNALRRALLDWDGRRVTRVLSASCAVYVASLFTDQFVLGLVFTLGLALAFDLPWWSWQRSSRSDGD